MVTLIIAKECEDYDGDGDDNEVHLLVCQLSRPGCEKESLRDFVFVCARLS